MSGRLILQTDLFFLAQLGNLELAAFGVPLRVMFLDPIIAFALAPIFSVFVSEAKCLSEAREKIHSATSLSILLGLGLCIVGLKLYPFTLGQLELTEEIKNMSRESLFWLTLAIPFKMYSFTSSMSLHAIQKGRFVIIINLIAIFTNAILDYVLIFQFQFGFKGSYLSSFFVTLCTCIFSYLILRKECQSLSFFRFPNLTIIKRILVLSPYEFARLGSERVISLLLIYFVSGTKNSALLAAFLVATEFLSFLLVPILALMRSSAIVMAKLQTESINKTEGRFGLAGQFWLVPLILSAALLGFGRIIGTQGYGLSEQALTWWRPFTIIAALFLPLLYFDSFLRGILQARKRFNLIAITEITSSWLILLPMFYISIYLESPWLAWTSIFGASLISFLILLKKSTPQV